MKIEPGKLLQQIDSPADLKKLAKDDLVKVCDELRQYIIDVVSVHGGHFGASLGVVELSVALHYAYNTPYDQLVWDVGHQAYGHKILTGRRDNFHTQRKYGGLSGFPKRSESEYDTFGVGHSSTSISLSSDGTRFQPGPLPWPSTFHNKFGPESHATNFTFFVAFGLSRISSCCARYASMIASIA